MDNKITKKRLGDLLAYEWLVIVIVCVVSMVGWHLVFNITGTKITTGQKFKILYDEFLNSNYEYSVIIPVKNEEAFSYEVMNMEIEILRSGTHNLLDTRHATEDCDVIVTSDATYKNTDDKDIKRTHAIIDTYKMWSYEEAVEYGDKYLEPLLKDGVEKLSVKYKDDVTSRFSYENAYTLEDLDQAKIDRFFADRTKGDNRFRDEENYTKGLQGERQRIERICYDVACAKYLLQYHPEIFYQYTRFTQNLFLKASDTNKMLLDYQKTNNLNKYGKEQLSYGVDLSKMSFTADSQGKYNVTSFFSGKGNGAKDLSLMMFDFIEYQPDLQFESLAFSNTVIKLTSNYLDTVKV